MDVLLAENCFSNVKGDLWDVWSVWYGLGVMLGHCCFKAVYQPLTLSDINTLAKSN
jgi:hypothetical protein